MDVSLIELINSYNLSTELNKKIYNYINSYYVHSKDNKLLKFYNNYKRKIEWNDLSFKSNFIFNEIMCKLMYKLHGKYDFESNNTIINFSNNSNIDNQLKKNGYCIGNIEKRLCDNIIDKIKLLNFKERKTNNIVKYGEPKNTYTSNSAWCNSQNDILNIYEVQKLICDHKLLDIIQKYLNAKPILTQTNLWFSHNINTDYSTNAQMYHRDFDHERWLKVFIYLNDVNEENGPHCFIKKSHLNIGTIERHAFVRESDETILKHYSKENLVKHIGEKGTLIIEDTRGYHKGLPVNTGSRVILQLEFAINPSSYPKTNFKIYTKDKYIKEHINKHKYTYQNII